MRLKLDAMLSGAARSLLVFVVSGTLAISVSAQVMPGKIAVLKRVEPGLENAVKWEWHVAPSDQKDWGLQSPDPTPTAPPSFPNRRIDPLSTRCTEVMRLFSLEKNSV